MSLAKIINVLVGAHKFDFKEIYISGLSSYPVYVCRFCGKTLTVDTWQLKRLPISMRFGCAKRFTNDSVT